MIGNELKAISDSIFRRPPPVDDAKALAEFIDQQSAFVTQKGIYEYARARAGHYAKVLFKEQQFADAVDRSRWGAYPIGLAMVGELVEGVLGCLALEVPEFVHAAPLHHRRRPQPAEGLAQPGIAIDDGQQRRAQLEEELRCLP